MLVPLVPLSICTFGVFLKQATSLQALKLLYISLVHDHQNRHESRDSLFLCDLILRRRAHVREVKNVILAFFLSKAHHHVLDCVQVFFHFRTSSSRGHIDDLRPFNS
jgi:hypothetical protein